MYLQTEGFKGAIPKHGCMYVGWSGATVEKRNRLITKVTRIVINSPFLRACRQDTGNVGTMVSTCVYLVDDS